MEADLEIGSSLSEVRAGHLKIVPDVFTLGLIEKCPRLGCHLVFLPA